MDWSCICVVENVKMRSRQEGDRTVLWVAEPPVGLVYLCTPYLVKYLCELERPMQVSESQLSLHEVDES